MQWMLAPTDLKNKNPDPDKAPDVISNSWTCTVGEGCTMQSQQACGYQVGKMEGCHTVDPGVIARGRRRRATRPAPESSEVALMVGYPFAF